MDFWCYMRLIKAYIFDLDGTLYPRTNPVYSEMSNKIKKWFKSQLGFEDNEEKQFDLLKLNYEHPLQAVIKLDLSADDFNQQIYGKLQKNDHLFIDHALIKIISNLSGLKFVVSVSTKQHTLESLNLLGLTNLFDGIYNPNPDWNGNKKIEIYESIRMKYGLHAFAVCVIGDTFELDLKDALDVGYKCCLISEFKYKGVTNIQSVSRLTNSLFNTTK